MGRKKRKPQAKTPEQLFQGTVIRSVGSTSRVKTESGEIYDCIIKGKFRIKDLNTTNPVAVGDEVRFSIPKEGELGVIHEILPRQNYILRKAISHQTRVHILAANLDQAIFLFTIDQPQTSTGFANRFLLVAEAYGIPIQFVINKVDLLESKEDLEKLAAIRSIYEAAGYPVIALSALDPQYRQSVESLLKDKRSFIGGHSGAGKSTLINLIDPDLDIKTSTISESTNKGRHTTTYAEMHPLSIGGYIIDSPGIKELGLVGFEIEELGHFFPEMRERLPDCRFHNCLHHNEPGCAVKTAVEGGEIHPSRYESYLKMLMEIKESKSR
ncbi:MAG: ribosome small subunit-dependent GTPase A [Bacteroidota bacterium]